MQLNQIVDLQISELRIYPDFWIKLLNHGFILPYVMKGCSH